MQGKMTQTEVQRHRDWRHCSTENTMAYNPVQLLRKNKQTKRKQSDCCFLKR